MTKRIGSRIRKSRHTLMQRKRGKGKLSIRAQFRQFAAGDMVTLAVSPAIHTGRYPLRFHGRTGEITGRQGTAYLIAVKDGGKRKTFIVSPQHLRKASS